MKKERHACAPGIRGRVRTAVLPVFVLMAVATGVRAQEPGVLKGRVTDIGTGQPVIGANVGLTGTAFRGVTGVNGNYHIKNVEAGAYELYAKTIGFVPFMKPGVIVDPGQTVTVDVAMEAEGVAELEKLVVTATAITSGEGALLRERQSAVEFTDAIGAQAISQSGAGNAAEAAKQITGATVVGGKYVYVRGLGDRYTYTTLNGVKLPNLDPDVNSVPMDLFPTAMIENIVTTKTFSPDKPGDFTGGSIDIKTRSYPEKLEYGVGASVGYNNQTTFKDGLLTYDGGGMDWLGIDDGTRALPEELEDGEPTKVTMSDLSKLENAEDTALFLATAPKFKAFDDQFVPDTRTAPLNQKYSAHIGNTVPLFGRPLGIFASLSYGRSFTKYEDAVTSTYDNTGRDTADVLYLDLLDSMSIAESKVEVLWGGLFNTAYEFSDKDKVRYDLLFLQNGVDAARHGSGMRSKFPGEEYHSYLLHYKQRTLHTSTLSGGHVLGSDDGLEIDWHGSVINSRQYEPNVRLATMKMSLADSNYTINYNEYPERHFRDLHELSLEGGVDGDLLFYQWTGEEAHYRFGAAAQRKQREFRETVFEYDLTSIDPRQRIDDYGLLFDELEGDVDSFFSPVYMGVDTTIILRSGAEKVFFGNTFSNVSTDDPSSSYDGVTMGLAGYQMAVLPLTERLKAVGGLRFEYNEREVVSRDTAIEPVKRIERDYLPALSFIYSLRENMNLRTAYGRTVAFPMFREMAPYVSKEFLGGDVLIGNPYLDRSLIDNVDVRWEWFKRPGEVTGCSYFYKFIRDPIALVNIGDPENGQAMWLNLPDATIHGIEIEASSKLDVIDEPLGWDVLNDFSCGGNFTAVRSYVGLFQGDSLYNGVYLHPETTVINESYLKHKYETRPFVGQSPYVVNLYLKYSGESTGLSAGLFFHRFGTRLDKISPGSTPDIYENAQNILDFIASYKLPYRMKLKFSVKNMLNTVASEEYLFNDNTGFFINDIFEGENIRKASRKGVSVSLGLSYDF